MSDFTYWGGSTVRDGKVRRLEARTFKEFCERYINVPVPFPMTRKGFLAHPDRDARKDGPWVSPVTYSYDEEGPRGNAHAEQSVLACFDFDEGDFVKEFFEAPEAIGEHLYPYNFIVFTSAKHTPEAPRLKLLIDIKPCDPALHPRIIAYFSRRLGLPEDFKGATETNTISQPHYRPLCFQGEKFGAVLASRTDGIAFDTDELPTPEEEMEEVIEGRRFASPVTSYDDDTLGLAYLPVQGITVEDIREPLFALDPDCDRKTWIGLCASIKHQFTNEEDAHAGFLLFDEWSATGSKYAGEKDTWARWRSFNAYPQGRAPRTIRSLFQAAIDSGKWNSTSLATRLSTSASEWIAQCEDADALMKEGPARIAAMPFRNEVVEDSLILKLKARLKELTGQNLSKNAIYKEVGAERRRGKAEKREKLIESPPEWLRPIYYVAAQNVFHNFGTGVQLSPVAFNNHFSKELMPKDGAEVPANGKPVIAPSDYALNIVQIPRVEETLYYPLRNGEDPIFDLDGRTYLNLYNPLSVPPADPDRAEEAGALLVEHVHVMLNNPLYERIFLDYLACNIKWPGRKIPWSPIVQSAEGVGKNFLGEIMRACLGKSNVKIIPPEVLCDKWNDFFAIGAVFGIFNEVHIPGERRERVSNSLKAMITDPYVTVNQKFLTPREMPNLINYVAFTNYRDALHLKPGDRRWFALESPIQSKAAVLALNASGHFDRMEPLLNELAGALRYWFLQREISPDFPFHGPPPSTEFREAIIEDSTPPMEEEINELIASDNPYVNDDVISFNHLTDVLPYEIKRRSAKVSHYLIAMGFIRIPNRVMVSGLRTNLWTHRERYFPELGTPKELVEMRVRANGGIFSL